MSSEYASPWIDAEELATPPPAVEGEIAARSAPTPRSQRLDRGVGSNLEAWSKRRGAGWPVGRGVQKGNQWVSR